MEGRLAGGSVFGGGQAVAAELEVVVDAAPSTCWTEVTTGLDQGGVAVVTPQRRRR